MSKRISNKKWIYQQTKGSRLYLFLLSIVVIISVITNLLIAYVLKLFIDAATNDTSLLLKDILILSSAVLIIGGLMYIAASAIRANIECNIELKIRTSIMDNVLNGDFYEIQKLHTGDVLTKLTNDVSAVATFYPNFVNDIIGGLSISILSVVSMFILSPKIAIAIVVIIPILIAIISLFNFPIAKADKLRKKNDEDNRIMMQEQLSKIKTIKCYSIQSRILLKLNKLYKEFKRSKVIFGIWEGFAAFSNGLIGNAMLIITLGLGSYLVYIGETTVGSLIAIVQLLNYIITPFSRISKAVSNMAQANTSADRIMEILSIKRASLYKEKLEDFNSLIIEDLSFSYEDKNVLNNINIEFRKNNAYCIIGDNGSGKSTLINLIAGLFEPKEGRIYLDSKSKGDNSTYISPQNHLSVVSSNELPFTGTIRENILLFNEDYDSDSLNHVAKMTNILDFINNLPKGFDTMILENGKTLSSGQIQRLVLSRALYYNNDIIIFDEPTSNLDIDSVDLFKSVIKEIKTNKLIIIVTHDDTIMQACDYCYKLVDGGIIRTSLSA